MLLGEELGNVGEWRFFVGKIIVSLQQV